MKTRTLYAYTLVRLKTGVGGGKFFPLHSAQLSASTLETRRGRDSSKGSTSQVDIGRDSSISSATKLDLSRPISTYLDLSRPISNENQFSEPTGLIHSTPKLPSSIFQGLMLPRIASDQLTLAPRIVSDNLGYSPPHPEPIRTYPKLSEPIRAKTAFFKFPTPAHFFCFSFLIASSHLFVPLIPTYSHLFPLIPTT